MPNRSMTAPKRAPSWPGACKAWATSTASPVRASRLYADAATRLSETQHQVTARREELVRLLGLNESQAQALKLPSACPTCPKALDPGGRRAGHPGALDLRLAQTALDAAPRPKGLNMVTSFTDIELTGRRNTTFDNAAGTRGTARLGDRGAPAVFDWGGMQRDAMNARTLAAANQLEAAARAAGSSLRESFSAYRTAYDVARHYRDEVVPVRKGDRGGEPASLQRHVDQRVRTVGRCARPGRCRHGGPGRAAAILAGRCRLAGLRDRAPTNTTLSVTTQRAQRRGCRSLMQRRLP